jgi:hypothetical protein
MILTLMKPIRLYWLLKAKGLFLNNKHFAESDEGTREHKQAKARTLRFLKPSQRLPLPVGVLYTQGGAAFLFFPAPGL